MLLLAHLLDILEGCAPLAQAESWDNVGLLLGQSGAPISRVLVTVDCTDAVLQEAQNMGADLIIAYHPTWFGAKKRLVGDDVLLDAARAGICIYSPHTALDAAVGGTNDVLADAASMSPTQRVPLRPAGGLSAVGMGRIGPVEAPQGFKPWLERLKERMGVVGALVACGPGRVEDADPVRRVAVCAGAGDSLWQEACAQNADTFVVGELRHHHALAARAHKLRVVALLHSGSERAALPVYARRLAQLAPNVTFRVSLTDCDPYAFY